MPFLAHKKSSILEDEHIFMENYNCPEDVDIPIADMACWSLYPKFNWIYNKIFIISSQGIDCSPSGIYPSKYPVIQKPITNLWGMGNDIRIINNKNEIDDHYKAGCFWMPYYHGVHRSLDLIVKNGNILYSVSTIGHKKIEGVFDYWETEEEDRSYLVSGWIKDNLEDYTGALNIELIEDKMIEVHLRISSQFVDLYHEDFLDNLVYFYSKGEWDLSDKREKGYSVIWFNKNSLDIQGGRYNEDGMSIYLFSKEDSSCTHPPEWYRIAVVNCFDLKKGKDTLNKIKRLKTKGN